MISIPWISTFCWTLAMSLVHSLWQGILVAIFVAFVLNSPLKTHSKFKLSFCCMLLVGVLPLLNFCWVGLDPGPDSVTQETLSRTGESVLFPLSEISNSSDAINNSNAKSQNELVQSAETTSPNTIQLAGVATAHSPERFVNFSGWTFIISATVTAGYLFGLAFMLLKLVFGLRSQSRLNRIGVGSDLQAPQQVLSLAEKIASSFGHLRPKIQVYQGAVGALVVGVFRPVVLISSSLITCLTPLQLEQVLRHELAHIYRFDPLTQLMQRIAESFAFFNPAVWVISREVSLLRELCCDEIVTREFSQQEYATTLVECGLLSVRNGNESLEIDRNMVVAANGNSASQLTIRVGALLGEPLGDRQRIQSNTFPLVISAWLILVTLFGFVRNHRF